MNTTTPKTNQSPIKILETTSEKITFQTKYSWAVALNAIPNSKRGNYYLLNNWLNQQKISRITTYQPTLLSKSDLQAQKVAQLRDYQTQDVLFLRKLKSCAIFSEMRLVKLLLLYELSKVDRLLIY